MRQKVRQQARKVERVRKERICKKGIMEEWMLVREK